MTRTRLIFEDNGISGSSADIETELQSELPKTLTSSKGEPKPGVTSQVEPYAIDVNNVSVDASSDDLSVYVDIVVQSGQNEDTIGPLKIASKLLAGHITKLLDFKARLIDWEIQETFEDEEMLRQAMEHMDVESLIEGVENTRLNYVLGKFSQETSQTIKDSLNPYWDQQVSLPSSHTYEAMIIQRPIGYEFRIAGQLEPTRTSKRIQSLLPFDAEVFVTQHREVTTANIKYDDSHEDDILHFSHLTVVEDMDGDMHSATVRKDVFEEVMGEQHMHYTVDDAFEEIVEGNPMIRGSLGYKTMETGELARPW